MKELPTSKEEIIRRTPRFRMLLTWLCAVGGPLVIFFFGGAFLIQNHDFADYMTLCPTMYNNFSDIDLKGIKKKILAIPAGGDTIDAWYFAVPGAKKLAIVSHGNAGNLSSRGFLAQILAEDGLSVLLYDYRGYGKSTGHASLTSILEDGLAVYDYASKNLHYPADKIVEFGESIGSTVACSVAAQRPVAALMLQSPIDSLPLAGKRAIPLLSVYPEFLFAEPHLNNVEAIKNIHAPIFIIHGSKDTTLSPNGSQSLFAAAADPKTLIYLPDCGHNDMGVHDSDLYLKSIAEFIRSLP